MTAQSKIAFLGFGEAAQAFAGEWIAAPPGRIVAFDIKTDEPAQRDAKSADYTRCKVAGQATLAEALDGAGVVLSLVTAGSAEAAARQAAGHLASGALFVDMNSVSPGAKVSAASAITAAGGRYVDAAVMAPVYPQRLKVPILVAGPHAQAGAEQLTALGFHPRAVAGEAGSAAAIKMIRSVMIKGIEALTAECILSAYAAGVEREVLASLGEDWAKRADYNLERMIVHGRRRSEEMWESAATVRALGLGGSMAAATAAWQARIGTLGLAAPESLDEKVRLLLEACREAPESPPSGAKSKA